MNPRYHAVSTRAEHRCEYCHAPEATFNFPFEVEHIGITLVGRASVERLKMNSSTQRTARLQWIRLGLFP